jgi:hypothetical protein
MNIKDFGIKLLSYIKRVDLGYSLNDRLISDGNIKQFLHQPTFYELDKDTGTWELLGTDKVKNELMCLVRHIESNRSIEIPKWWFDLMFVQTPDEPLNVDELLRNITKVYIKENGFYRTFIQKT